MVILVVIIIILAWQIFPIHNSTVYRYDDTEFMNVAVNILRGHGMVTSLVYPIATITGSGFFTETYDPSIILKYYTSIYNRFNISPLFMLIFAGYLGITQANPTNWVLIGSLFNIAIFNIFICLYYLWVRAQFGRIISFVSSVIIICTPIFLIHLTLIEMYPLSWLLILVSFYFIKNTRRDYILFGIFSAFAVLSNQTGIVAIVSYVTFLLIKKELKGLAYVLGTWFFTVLPWMIYSYIHYADFGSGLGIPFTDHISSLINSFFFHHQKVTSINFSQIIHLDSTSLPFSVFSNALTSETGVSFMIMIILFFSGIAFISLTSLKKITKKTSILYGILTCIISTSVIVYHFYQNPSDTNILNYVVQGLILFGIPVLLGVLFWLKKDVFLEKNIPRLWVLLLFLALHCLLAIYYLSIAWVGFDEKYVWPLFFLMLPLGIYGISKIFRLLPNGIFSNPKIIFMIIPLILVPFLITMYDTTFSQLKNYESEIVYPNDISNYVLQHFDKNIVFAAQEPGQFFLATGNPAVAMKISQPFDIVGYANLVKTFDVKYMVVNANTSSGIWTLETNPLGKYDIVGPKLFGKVMYHSANGYSVITTLTCLSPTNNTDQLEMIVYGTCLEKEGNLKNASMIYANDYQGLVSHNINLLFYLGWKYDSEYNVGKIYDLYNSTIASNARVDLMQKILSVVKQDVKDKFSLAEELEFRGGYKQAILIYENILDVDPFNQKSIDSIFKIYSNYGTSDMLDNYTQFEQSIDRKFEFEKNNRDIFGNFDDRQEQISIIKNKIKVWKHYSDDDRVYDLYYNWYNNMDQFDTESVEGFAQYSLKEHMPVGVVKNLYERLLSLEPDENKKKEIEQIIESLK